MIGSSATPWVRRAPVEDRPGRIERGQIGGELRTRGPRGRRPAPAPGAARLQRAAEVVRRRLVRHHRDHPRSPTLPKRSCRSRCWPRSTLGLGPEQAAVRRSDGYGAVRSASPSRSRWASSAHTARASGELPTMTSRSKVLTVGRDQRIRSSSIDAVTSYDAQRVAHPAHRDRARAGPVGVGPAPVLRLPRVVDPDHHPRRHVGPDGLGRCRRPRATAAAHRRLSATSAETA